MIFSLITCFYLIVVIVAEKNFERFKGRIKVVGHVEAIKVSVTFNPRVLSIE